MKNVIKPLAKSFFFLGLTATASAADAGIHKQILGSGHNHLSFTILIISNGEREGIVKIVKFRRFWFIINELANQFKMKLKKKKGGFFSTLLGMLRTSVLGHFFAGKGINRAGEGVVRAGYRNKKEYHKNKMNF